MTDKIDNSDKPDLAAGVASDSIAEGQSVAGKFGDDAVLIARSNGKCFAIGATCTHYGGPLAEGIVVDGTVRCPWHHAAFRLDNGQAVRAPALDAVPCWRVEESNGIVRIVGPAEASGVPQPPAVAQPPSSIVIVGAGAAGIAAADALRKEGYKAAITIIDSDPDAPVDRPNLSKDYLAGTAEEAWVTLRTDEFFSDNAITIVRARVTGLDRAARQISLDDGKTLTYDRLLIATGASPIQLPLPNAAGLPFFTLRSLADSRRIIGAANSMEKKGNVAVIGASFIGLEVAASLTARGREVHVIAPETIPLERVLGPELGKWIHGVHVSRGVIFHLGQKPRELVADGVILENGEHIPAAFVVAGVGVRPNIELAEKAGLTIDRGIAVDALLMTSDPNIYAAGDVARYPDARTGEMIRVEHWVAAERQGQAAARNMLGANEPFTDVPFFWSAHYDSVVCYTGHAERWDRIDIDGSIDGQDCEVRYLAGDRVLAVATVGRDKASLLAERAMEKELNT